MLEQVGRNDVVELVLVRVVDVALDRLVAGLQAHESFLRIPSPVGVRNLQGEAQPLNNLLVEHGATEDLGQLGLGDVFELAG
ncbi:MAG: hypothetical protein JSW67_00755 [Candidatus Latescibacterota bacterium]|nr:MAG: hypothetical protein JSW67_00755 [Candidatus Latescibacterota bacterium]